MNCWMRSHGKGEKRSGKTGCPFCFALIKGEGGTFHIAKASNLEHNHEICVRGEPTLIEDTQDMGH
jgi:hypothetical protein